MQMSVKLSMILLSLGISVQASAQDLSPSQIKAKRLLERLSSTKVPADHPLLLQMSARIDSGDDLGAAELATTHPNFLNTTVKLMALKMSTREETIRIEFNDFAASMIGVTRDGVDARQLLQGNFYYTADATKIPMGITIKSDLKDDILKSNNHYRDLENPAIDIGSVLVPVVGQKVVDGADVVVDNPDPAGILTSRAFMGAHAIDGTNRRPVEYTFREFMCIPIQEWADTKAVDLRVGRDIDRFPGGDHMKFQTTCKGCHTQMDSLRGAFAKWDFQGQRIISGGVANRGGNYSADGVSNKLNKNGTVFPGGYVTKDDSFVNNSRLPANEATFGWRGETTGNGVKGFGTMVSNSRRFSQCMVKRVYDAVCRTNLKIDKNMSFIAAQAVGFEQNNYNMKTLFKQIAISQQCLGQ
jgi:hypothetical protein